SSRRRHTRLSRDWSSDVCFPIYRSMKTLDTRSIKKKLNGRIKFYPNSYFLRSNPFPAAGHIHHYHQEPVEKRRNFGSSSLLSPLRSTLYQNSQSSNI